jgi:hypothetical protein
VTPSSAPAGRAERPATEAGWKDVVAVLYARRAQAFATAASPTAVAALGRVYTAGSAERAADERQLRTLAAAGEQLRGFAPVVVRVTTASGSGPRVELRLVDRWSGYDVVAATGPDGAALRRGAPRGDAVVRMVLVSTTAGWRIEEVQRLG